MIGRRRKQTTGRSLCRRRNLSRWPPPLQPPLESLLAASALRGPVRAKTRPKSNRFQLQKFQRHSRASRWRTRQERVRSASESHFLSAYAYAKKVRRGGAESMTRRRNSEILWSLMTRIKSPNSLQERKKSASCKSTSNASKPRTNDGSSSTSTTGSASRARLNLCVSAIAPGLTFGVFVVVGNSATVVSAGAVVPSLLVAAVASLLAGEFQHPKTLFSLLCLQTDFL